MTGPGGASPRDGSVSEGDTGPVRSFGEVERRDFVRFAGASGDFNPIHYDDSFATRSGNPSVFAPGMLVAGFASSYVSRWLGLRNVSTFDVRFREKVWPGDSLTATGRVLEVVPLDRVSDVTGEVLVENQTGETVLDGTVEARLPNG